jgi:multidrug efflux system membrane fusion protein
MKTKLFLLLQLTALACLFGCNKAATKQPPPKPVKVKMVEKQTAHSAARYSASIRPNSQVEVAFKVGGYVEAIKQMRDLDGSWRTLQAGDVVLKGAELARLRQSDYQARVNQAVSQHNEAKRAVDAGHAQLNEAASAISTAETNIAEAQAAFDKAKRDYERAQRLYAAESLTRVDFEAAKTQQETAQARLDGARSQLATTKARVVTAKANIGASQARVKTAEAAVTEVSIPLQDTVLRAPISGIVLERRVETGALVPPNAAGFLLADTTTVKAVFGVPDMALTKLKLGDTVNVVTEALDGQEFSGHISKISPTADPNSRVFDVEVAIPNQHNLLKPGMITSLELREGGEPVDVAVVPLVAIVRPPANPNAYAVLVVTETNGQTVARLREVATGETFGNTIAVTNGLQFGEQVITTGAALVSDGERVQVIP